MEIKITTSEEENEAWDGCTSVGIAFDQEADSVTIETSTDKGLARITMSRADFAQWLPADLKRSITGESP